MKPFAESSEENKHVILDVLNNVFKDVTSVLEIGSGTGQHAVFFSEKLPHLVWQPSELAENLPGIRLWLDEALHENINEPLHLDVNNEPWPLEQTFDAVFTANTVHIVSNDEVAAMFRGVASVLKNGGLFCMYGPFNYHGQFTSESNARFDQWLKQRDPESGIKDLSELKTYAKDNGMSLQDDIEMPVNNRILVWKKN